MTMKYPHKDVIMEQTPNTAYIYDKDEKNLDEVRLHQETVKQLMNIIACEIRCRATYHDYTKLKHDKLTFSEHCHDDFDKEYESIQKELKRIKREKYV